MFKNSLVCNTDVERAHVHYLGVCLVLIGLCSRFTHTASRQRLCGFCLGFISLLLLLHCFPFAFALSINFHSIRKHSLSLNHVANPSNCSNLSVVQFSAELIMYKAKILLDWKGRVTKREGEGRGIQLECATQIRAENSFGKCNRNWKCFGFSISWTNKQATAWLSGWLKSERDRWVSMGYARQRVTLFILFSSFSSISSTSYFHCPEPPSSPPAYLLQSIQFVE